VEQEKQKKVCLVRLCILDVMECVVLLVWLCFFCFLFPVCGRNDDEGEGGCDMDSCSKPLLSSHHTNSTNQVRRIRRRRDRHNTHEQQRTHGDRDDTEANGERTGHAQKNRGQSQPASPTTAANYQLKQRAGEQSWRQRTSC